MRTIDQAQAPCSLLCAMGYAHFLDHYIDMVKHNIVPALVSTALFLSLVPRFFTTEQRLAACMYVA